jgi:dienelactone hydrolase
VGGSAWKAAAAAALVSLLVAAAAYAAAAFDPAVEATNYSKLNERFRYVVSAPGYQAKLHEDAVKSQLELADIRANDPERNPDSVCASYSFDCAGDIRISDWGQNGYGIVRDVLYTNRNGATIPGRVWATRAGPRKRPAIVIGPGGLAPQTVYWFGAASLAKAGYVVLTFDVQGQGRADSRGEAPDDASVAPFDGTAVSQTDGIEDGLDFLLSTPRAPYVPRPSCLSGTSHAAKQARRVKEGFDTAYDPMWSLIDRKRIGIVGHSLGAYGASFVGQKDPRVGATVAWDNLDAPKQANEEPNGVPHPCAAFPQTRVPPPITKPALGLSADYHQPPEPNTSLPDPEAKSQGFHAYQKAGVDSGEIVIRGGSHYEFSFLPAQNWPASLRGADMATWYTIAWFDKYLKRDPSADRRLLTDRWRHDTREAEIDPNGDGNKFSFYYRSGLDIGLAGGGRAVCSDLRAGCAALTSHDGAPPFWSYVTFANTPDVPAGGSPKPRRSTVRVPRTLSLAGSRRRLVVRLGLVRRTLVRVRMLRGRGGGAVARAQRSFPAGRHRLRVVLPRGARPGRYRVEVTLSAAGAAAVSTRTVRVRR